MEQQVLSITQINEYIRARLDADPLLGSVAVRGEISNYKVYPSGHHYFTLKDEGGALKCVMFRNNALRLKFRPLHLFRQAHVLSDREQHFRRCLLRFRQPETYISDRLQ